MNIVVHRRYGIDAVRVKRHLQGLFAEHFGDKMKVVRDTIVIHDVYISFRFGDVTKLAGMRFEYYNVDTLEADRFLKQSAVKFGGLRAAGPNEILDIVFNHINKQVLDAQKLIFGIDVSKYYPLEMPVTDIAKEPKPVPRSYLTTYNPYMSKDWKKRYFDEYWKKDIWDVDAASMCPTYYIQPRRACASSFKQILNDMYGKPKSTLDKIGRSLLATDLEELANHSPSKELYEVGIQAAASFNEGVIKVHEDAIDAVRHCYCANDVKAVMAAYESMKEQEESMKNYTDMCPTAILMEMNIILNSERNKAFIFRPDEWVWEISRDVREKLDRPCIVMNIGVRTIPDKINHIKLVRKVKEEEKSMNSLCNNNKITIVAADGTKYPAVIRTISMVSGEATQMEIDLVEPTTSQMFVTMPRHFGCSEAMKQAQLAKELLFGVDLNHRVPQIKDVKFEDPVTVVFWADGTKTVVRAQGEAYDPEKGLAMAISRKALGNKRDYYHTFLKWLKKFRKQKDKGAKTC